MLYQGVLVGEKKKKKLAAVECGTLSPSVVKYLHYGATAGEGTFSFNHRLSQFFVGAVIEVEWNTHLIRIKRTPESKIFSMNMFNWVCL